MTDIVQTLLADPDEEPPRSIDPKKLAAYRFSHRGEVRAVAEHIAAMLKDRDGGLVHELRDALYIAVLRTIVAGVPGESGLAAEAIELEKLGSGCWFY